MSRIRWFHGPRCPSLTRVDGKTIIVTGSNTGIGKATARELAFRGGRVIMACRDMIKANEAADEINKSLTMKEESGCVITKQLDLASFASIREFSQDVLDNEERVDILINNAGVFACSYCKSEDGFELQFGVNHLGPFLLTMSLLDRLRQCAPSRIVIVASKLHAFGTMQFDNLNSETHYNRFAAYNNSKLANMLFARELSKRLEGTGVNVYAVHPGIALTDCSRHLTDIFGFILWPIFAIASPFVKTPAEAAQTSLYCAASKKLENQTGLFYSKCKVIEENQKAKQDDDAKKLWDISCELTHWNDTL